jgi:hypothetical protein
MRIVKYCLIFVVIIFVLFGCNCEPTEEELKQQILDIHKELINAHFRKDLDFFTRGISEDFVSVSNGEINKPTPEEITANYKNYITNTTFSEYRDLQEPIVGFSKDGSIAWAIVKVKVKGERKLEDGTNRDVDFICAWLTLYEKTNTGWDVLAEVSTFK